MMMVSLHLMLSCHFMIQIISLDTVSLLLLVSSDNFPPMCTKTSLMVLDDCLISSIKLSSSVVDKYRLFMELMHISKDSDIFRWRWNLSCGCLLFCYFPPLFLLSPIIIRLYTLFHFSSGEVDYWSWIRVTPGGGVLIFQFYLLLPKYHNKLYLHLLKREDSSLSRCVIRFCPKKNVSGWLSSITLCSDDHHRIVGWCCEKLNRHKFVFCNLIDYFEDFWMEATHACVFVILLGGVRGGKWVLEKLYLIIFPADNVKASHV